MKSKPDVTRAIQKKKLRTKPQSRKKGGLISLTLGHSLEKKNSVPDALKILKMSEFAESQNTSNDGWKI